MFHIIKGKYCEAGMINMENNSDKISLRILVTGGAGFIGSNLCEKLLAMGHRIFVIDNFNDYYSPVVKRDNINEIYKFMQGLGINKESFLVFEGDIRDRGFITEVFQNKFDMVIHLAAMAGVRPSIQNPELYYEVNVNGTLNLLEHCRGNNINKFVFASSSSVYGNNKSLPFRETDNVDYPISPYAATKKAGELLCYSYHHLYNISIACLRFFTVFGPRQRPDLAIHKFVELISKGRDIPFYGDGSSKRDYTFITDIVDGIVRSMEWLDKDEVKYEIFNLGEYNTISLARMVETIEKELGKSAKLTRLASQPGDVDITYADISKAKKLLGYNPTTEFEYGVREFIKWYRDKNYL